MDQRLPSLEELNETPANGDLLYIVDVSDSTDHATGSSKKISITNLLSAVSPGGSNTHVQFNNSGVLGGSANFTWTGTALVVTGQINIDNLRLDGNTLNVTDANTRLTLRSGTNVRSIGIADAFSGWSAILDTSSLASSSKTFTFPNTTGTLALTSNLHDAVTLAGEDYLSLSGQQITANAIDLDNLSATGTPSSSTFLRGDNTWATPAGGSGDVATDSIWDAKGDLAVGTGSDTASRLAVGSNGQVLTADSGEATGVKWATVAGTGDVSKVGTPVDNQIGVWTGDGTIEGDANLTWNGSTFFAGASDAEVRVGANNSYLQSNSNVGLYLTSAQTQLLGTSHMTLEAGTGNFFLKGGSGTHYGILNLANIASSNKTFTFPNTTGNLVVDAHANTFTARQTITIADTANAVGLTINQNDVTNNPNGLNIVNAGSGKELTLENSQASLSGVSPAVNLDLYYSNASPSFDYSAINFYFKDSAGNKDAFAVLGGGMDDNTSGSEQGYYFFQTILNGSLGTRLIIGSDVNGIGVGNSSAAGVIESRGNQDLILQTGNGTTGTITITDGANGDITLAPNGTGKVVLGSTPFVGADAGADAFFGWDDTAGQYENLSKAEALAILNVEDGADVTDTANVTSAGALMDSEVTNLAQVKAFDTTDYEAAGGISTHAALTATHGATGAVVGTTNTQTLTNKRVTQRVVTTTDDATSVINVDTTDVYELSAIANNTEFTVTGTPTDGQKLIVRYKDAGVSKTLTWTFLTAIGITLPTATTAGKWEYVGCIYNSAASAWHGVAVSLEA